MRFPSIVGDQAKTLETILRGLDNRLTAANNLAPEGTAGQVLTSNGPNTAPSYQAIPGTSSDAVTGTGTPGTVPLWDGAHDLTDSKISQVDDTTYVNGPLSLVSTLVVAGAVTLSNTLSVVGLTTLQGGLQSSQGTNTTTTLLAPSNPIIGQNDWVLVGSGSAGQGSVAIGSVVQANIFDVVIGSGAGNFSTTTSPYGAVVIGNSTQLSTDSGVVIGAAVSPSSANVFEGVAIGASIGLPPGLGLVTTFVGVGNNGVLWTPTNPNQCSIVALGDGNTFDLAASIAIARGVIVGTNNTVRHNNVAVLGYGITSAAANTTYIGGFDDNTIGVGTSTIVFGPGDSIALAYAPITLRLTNASGTNIVGPDLIVQPGLSTGAGAAAFVRIRASSPLGSGTTLQTAADVLVVGNGAVTVTGTLTASSTVQGTQLISTIATGTAPFVVASTTVVANLHATNSDQLGGVVATSYALLASPTFTGTPAAPTAAPGTNTTQLATTAFVQAATSALVTGVSSVFGRTGAVVAATNDYGFSQISGTVANSQLSGLYTGVTQLRIGQYDPTGDGNDIQTAGNIGIRAISGNAGVSAGRANGTFGSLTATNSGDILAFYDMWGYTGSTWFTGASFRGIALENWTSTNRGSKFQMLATGIGGSTSLVPVAELTVTEFYPVTARTKLVSLGISSTNLWLNGYFGGSLYCQVAGGGLLIKEGTNARMGTAVLVAGTKVVSTTAVTANSRIFLMCNTPGGTPGWLQVSARVAGTSFTILSSSATDTSTVAWVILEPA